MPESDDWRVALTPPYAFNLGYSRRRSIQLVSTDEIDLAIRFVADEPRGMGHGRMRAVLCRRLKHVELTAGQKRRLSEAIGRRLLSGQFSEQFFCQLRTLSQVDHEALQHWCGRALGESMRSYVHRFAQRAPRLPGRAVVGERWSRQAGRRYATFPASTSVCRRKRWVPDSARRAKQQADQAALTVYVHGWSQSTATWRVAVAKFLHDSAIAPQSPVPLSSQARRLSEGDDVLEKALMDLSSARSTLRRQTR